MTLLEKIKNLVWFDLINKLKDILQDFNTRVTVIENKPVVESVETTASNGLNSNNNVIRLGGTLTETTNIDGYYFFNIGELTPLNRLSVNAGDSGYSNFSQLRFSSSSFKIAWYSNGAGTAQIQLGNYLGFGKGNYIGGGYSGSESTTAFHLGENSLNSTWFKDLRTGSNQTGLEYFADYSANYSARSLVDRNYVDTRTIPVYANDAAADADTNLLSGRPYSLTGNRAVFRKP